MGQYVKSHFHNVDLEITSSAKLDSLASAMGEGVIVLHSGPGPRPKERLLAVESARRHRSPDSAIAALCEVVERLSPAGRRTWSKTKKVFDIGFGLRANERVSRFALKPSTLRRVIEVGATLAVTYYREDELGPSRSSRTE